MTTTTPKNTRVSDLNKIINYVEEFKTINPEIEELLEGDIENQLVLTCAMEFVATMGDEVSLADSYLWVLSGVVLSAVTKLEQALKIEDPSILASAIHNIPAMLVDLIGGSVEGIDDLCNVEELYKLGATKPSDFFVYNTTTKETN